MANPPTHLRRDLFLVLDSALHRLSYFRTALAPMERQLAHATRGADIYYAVSTGVALLAVHLDRAEFAASDEKFAMRQAEAAGVPVLDPKRLDDGDRAAFYGSYLEGYDLRVPGLAGMSAALSELGKRTWQRRPRADTAEVLEDMVTTQDPRPAGLDRAVRPPPSLATPRPRATPPDMPEALKGRRLGSTPPGTPRPAAAPRGHLPRGKHSPTHKTPDQRQGFTLVEQAAMARAERSHRAPTVRYPLEGELSGAAPANDPGPNRARGKGRPRERKPTVPETPIAKTSTPRPHPHSGTKQQLAPPPPKHGWRNGRRVADGTGPNPAIDERDQVTLSICVRYQRGGEWVTARLRSLSLKGSYLVAGALPRKGETVRIELAFARVKATVHGFVYHVTTIEDAIDTGAAGFALRFDQENTSQRNQLVALLKRARAAGITIKPPPERAAVRFPVNWPVRVGTRHGGFRADARDLSTGGLFVATGKNLDGEELAFRLPLDNGQPPVCGRARVARKVTDDQALERGLETGYGLEIIGLSNSDAPRYQAFLARVRQRIERRVIVAAAPGRLKQLMSAFAAIGYSVTGGSETHALLQLASQSSRPPDAAVIDTSLGACGQDKNRVARDFSNRGVACVPSDNEPPTLTRAVVDRLLGVTA